MIQTLGLAPAHIVTSPAIDSFAYLSNFGPSHTLLRPSQARGSMVKQSTGAAAAAASKPIPTIRVGCDFSGLGMFMLAMRKTHAKLQTGKYKVQHCFSSDKMRAAKKLMMHTDPPEVFYADVKNRNWKELVRTNVYSHCTLRDVFDGWQVPRCQRSERTWCLDVELACLHRSAPPQSCRGGERRVAHGSAPQVAPSSHP